MAQTDARPGFRLPWSSDRQPTDSVDGEPTTDSQADGAWPSEDSARPTASLAADVAESDAPAKASAGSETGVDTTPPAGDPTPLKPSRKPTKFMADLTKAMQAAAEDARSRALTQLQADAKTHVETIHGRSATEAAGLRRAADDDVAAVREWSKAEIARIREETETRISARKALLEAEIEQHAGVIEREIDAVQKTVAAFEDDMAAFFERLLGEEDPSRFATMAENLPEAPSFDSLIATEDAPETTEAVAEPIVEAVEAEAEAVAEETVEAIVAETTDADADTTTASDDAVATASIEGVAGAEGGTGEGVDGEVDREAAFAAIQAAAEAAASAEVAADAAARAEAVADVAIEIMGNHEDEAEADPRFAALGLSPDFDAAEAEALEAAATSDEEVPVIADDALAARLAGLVPGKDKGATADAAATQVVVVGLVSVASIASFKRHLGRVTGVQSVGVSSGPEGEFIFAVTHGPDIAIRDAIPALPSFQARVTGSADGVVHVSAHDPESDA